METSAILSPMRTRDPDAGPEPLFSPHLSTTSVANWPISFTEPSDRSGHSRQLDFRVEQADGMGKCVVCEDKLPKEWRKPYYKRRPTGVRKPTTI